MRADSACCCKCEKVEANYEYSKSSSSSICAPSIILISMLCCRFITTCELIEMLTSLQNVTALLIASDMGHNAIERASEVCSLKVSR